MSNEGFKVQASIKDSDGDMVNFRGDSPEELAAYLNGFDYGAYAQAKANLRGSSSVAAIAQPSAPAAPTAPAAPSWPPAAPQQAEAPSWAAAGAQKICPCGQTAVYKAGTSKAGKPYALWSCPLQKQKNDGHLAEFVN